MAARHISVITITGGQTPTIGIATAAASEAAQHERAFAADDDEADARRHGHAQRSQDEGRGPLQRVLPGERRAEATAPDQGKELLRRLAEHQKEQRKNDQRDQHRADGNHNLLRRGPEPRGHIGAPGRRLGQGGGRSCRGSIEFVWRPSSQPLLLNSICPRRSAEGSVPSRPGERDGTERHAREERGQEAEPIMPTIRLLSGGRLTGRRAVA